MIKIKSYDWKVLEKSAQTPVYIDTNEQLLEHCDRWLSLPMIAIDTEFQRVDTFYPVAGLIQVGDDSGCYLIDPLKITDYEPLKAVFQASKVLKIIHAGSEDLELFRKLLGVVPQPLYDTQLAAAYLGWGFTMGLQRMLEQVLQISLGKAETTSNWLQRPLTKNQELYAALDVAYLVAVYQVQISQIQHRDCYGWFLEDSVRSVEKVAAVNEAVESDEYYLRFSQMWSIADYKLVALKELSIWRERESRLRDTPRNWVLKNQSIISIITQWPTSLAQLHKIEEMRAKSVREDGEPILKILANAKQQLADKGPVQGIKKPLDPVWNKRFRKLKQIAISAAEQEEIVPELVLRKKDLEALVRTKEQYGKYQIPEGLVGWRSELFGQAILNEIAQY